jgi:hypothetical protein
LREEPGTAEWLFDLLIKLGQEDDAYHATGLVLMEYGADAAVTDDGEEPATESLAEPGLEDEDDIAPELDGDADQTIANLPKVRIRLDATPRELMPSRFLATMVNRVLGITPVTMHREARKRRAEAAGL